jgi:hypothetical protein
VELLLSPPTLLFPPKFFRQHLSRVDNIASNGVATRNYIGWDAEGVEKVLRGESEVADMINTIQKAQFNSIGTCMAVS